MAPRQLTWLITGTSSGFGSLFVSNILSRGDRVIATARNLSSISHLSSPNLHTLELDVTSPFSNISTTIQDAISIYGYIDILVNNAGYMTLGTLEDVEPETLEQQFQTNVFGAVNVTRALMPHFRGRKEGLVVWIGSIAGRGGGGAAGPYCASKSALATIAESFAGETAHLGIKSLLIEPGLFRTKFLSVSNRKMIETKYQEYEIVTKGLYDAMDMYAGNQPGDPEKAVRRIVDVVKQEGSAEGRDIPSRLLLGADAVAQAKKKCADLLKEIEEWEELSVGLEFDN